MSTTISFTIEKPFVEKIEKVISKTGFYQSKSEFLRDAAREKLHKMLELEKDLKVIEKSRKRLQKKAKFKGYLSQKDRNKLAKEYLEFP